MHEGQINDSVMQAGPLRELLPGDTKTDIGSLYSGTMPRFRSKLLYWQLAYTGNFGLNYRKTWRAYFHPPGPQYLPCPSTMYLL